MKKSHNNTIIKKMTETKEEAHEIPIQAQKKK